MLAIVTKHRFLLWQFIRRQIEQRHRGSMLGLAWSGLQPLLLMTVYTVVFGLIFKGRYSGSDDHSTLDYALGVFLSATIFQTISETITTSASAVLSQPNLVKKVVFPLEVLPLANLGAMLYQFCVSMVLVLAGIVTFGPGLSWSSFYVVLALLPLVPLTLGIAFLLSALGVFLRDIQHAAGPLSMVLMYSSAVFYSTSMVPTKIWTWLRFNPLVHVVEQARNTLLWHQPPQLGGLLYSLCFGSVLCLIGIFIFKKLKPAFADVI